MASFTYPGIYIQEVPSTVHTIVPAPTAVTAFVGRARRGPLNTPIRIHSFADFERAFGGVWPLSEMPNSVQQYFLNGGSDGYVVRAVTQALAAAPAGAAATIALPSSMGALTIAAQNPGSWFGSVILSVDWNTRKVSGVRKPDEFNLTMIYNEIDPVTGASAATVERFANVSYLASAANYLVTTLKNDSSFIAVAGVPPQAKPNPGNYSLSGMVWSSGFAFTAGALLIDSNGNLEVVTTAGTSGRTLPVWSAVAGGLTTDGSGPGAVTWTNVGTFMPGPRQPLTPYAVGQIIFDGASLQRVVSVAGAGLSGSGAPVWSTTREAGAQTTQAGGFVWTDAGPTGSWRAGTYYSLGAAFVDPAGNLQVMTTAGTTSFPSAPLWASATGQTTADGAAAWQNYGTFAGVANWAAATAYAVGEVVSDSNGNLQVVTTAGTSDAVTPPAWSMMPGKQSAEVSGTLVWTYLAASMADNWNAAAVYSTGDVVCDGTDLQLLNAGPTTAGIEPAWVYRTADGSVEWANVGDAGSWQASGIFSAGSAILVAGNLQVVTSAGQKSSAGAGAAPAFAATPGASITDGDLEWTNFGSAPSGGSWTANTFYPTGSQLYDSNGSVELVTAGGISGQNQPQWSLPAIGNLNPTIVDGSVTWKLQILSTLSDGQALLQADLSDPSLEASKNGIYALKDAEIFTLMTLPPYAPQENGGTIDLDPSYAGIWADALAFCKVQRAVLLVDPPSPSLWIDETHAYQAVSAAAPALDTIRDPNSVLYYPWLEIADPLLNGRPRDFAPSATVAGVMARIDGTRGVWKSPAGEEAKLLGVASLQVLLSDSQNGDLNPLGINCLRTFPIIGSVVWGARTLDGADSQASQWKYVAVRRMALYIEDSLYAGTGWALFEPNDEPLWSELRLNVGSFMRNLFRQGALQGSTPKQAFFVKCDSDTTTQTDINNGVVNILVGFAPLKPAEFIVIKISQITGDVSSS